MAQFHPAPLPPLRNVDAYTSWPGGVDPTVKLYSLDLDAAQKGGRKATRKNRKNRKASRKNRSRSKASRKNRSRSKGNRKNRSRSKGNRKN
jgi:hypothetical protein